MIILDSFSMTRQNIYDVEGYCTDIDNLGLICIDAVSDALLDFFRYKLIIHRHTRMLMKKIEIC